MGKKLKNKKYAEKILYFSKELNRIQQPIRLLDAIKWNDGLYVRFKKSQFKEFPILGPDYYTQSNFLGFDPLRKREELSFLRDKIKLNLGPQDAVGKLLRNHCKQYDQVIHLLMARGTKHFYQFSKKLFGSSMDDFDDGHRKVIDLGILLDSIGEIDTQKIENLTHEKNLSSDVVVKELQKRSQKYFKHNKVCVKLEDNIVSDAAAGATTIKIKNKIKFNERDINLLEVHEGWVHVGTSLNGSAQRYAKWLFKGPPGTTMTQEGLAVFMEVLTFNSSPHRIQKINNRILACHLAETGAGVIELFEFFRSRGCEDYEAYLNTQRVFRGTSGEGGGAFTKDIVYCRGYISIYNYLRTAVRMGQTHLIPFIFSGKLNLRDIPLIYQLYDDGIINLPRYLPPQFKDLKGLLALLSFSNFLNLVDISKSSKRIQFQVK